MRPYQAPFYFNIKFYQPDPINQKKNSAHIRYIGTRPGVDRGEIESPLELTPETPEHHVKYAHERPRSHGLFGPGNEEINMAEIQRSLQEHNGIVWRIFVSIICEVSKILDFENREAWEALIKQQLPLAANEMGLQESNLNWVAAFHAEVGHPHAHIVMWEKKPKKRKGKVSLQVKNAMRKRFVQHIYAADRDRYSKEKTAMRDLMKQRGVSTLQDAVRVAREFRQSQYEVNQLFALTGHVRDSELTAKMDLEQQRELIEMLRRLSKMLPGHGRLMMKFMSDPVKAEATKIAQWMYEQPQFAPNRKVYEESAEILARPYSNREEQLKKAVENARAEMINRIAQSVLRAAAEIEKDNQFAMHPERAKIVLGRLSYSTGSVPDITDQDVAKQILKDIHRAGLSKDVYLEMARHFDLPALRTTEINSIFSRNPANRELNDSVLFLLKSSLGEKEAERILLDAKYDPEKIEMLRSIKSEPINMTSAKQWVQIPDVQARIVENYSKTLLSCGASSDEAMRMIKEWNGRSGRKISEEKIEKSFKRAEKVVMNARDWGREVALSKKDFNEMSRALGVDLLYPWRTNKEREFAVKGHTVSMADNLFKTALRQLESAVKRSEAEKDRAVRRAMERIKREAEREEKERERGR